MENSSAVKKFYSLFQEIVEDPDCLKQAADIMKNDLKEELSTIFKAYYAALRAKEQQLVAGLDARVQSAIQGLPNFQKALRSKRIAGQQLKKRYMSIARRIQQGDGRRNSVLQKEVDSFNDELVEFDRDVQKQIESLTEECKRDLRKKEHWRVLEKDRTVLREERQSIRNRSSASLRRFNTEANKSPTRGGSKHESRNPSKFARVTEEYALQPRPEEKENYSSHFGLEYLNSFRRSEQRSTHTHTLSVDMTLNPSGITRSISMDRSRSKSPERKHENQIQIQQVVEIIREQQPPMLLLNGLHIRDFFIPSILDAFLQANLRFGVIKLTKNEITDEGFRMLLKGLRDYPYLHTLNLTSNFLTEDSFDTIARFRHRNPVLCNYYFSGNKINVSRCKGVREKFKTVGINVYF